MNLKPNVKFKVFRSSVTETAKPFTTEKKNPPPRPPPPSLIEACPLVPIPPILENFMASPLDEIKLNVNIEPSPPASPPGVPPYPTYPNLIVPLTNPQRPPCFSFCTFRCGCSQFNGCSWSNIRFRNFQSPAGSRMIRKLPLRFELGNL